MKCWELVFLEALEKFSFVLDQQKEQQAARNLILSSSLAQVFIVILELQFIIELNLSKFILSLIYL